MIRHVPVFAVAIVCLTAFSMQAAGIQEVDIFKNSLYNQTTGAAPASPSFFFADLELTSQNAGDFTSVSVAYPGPGSPTSLPQVSPTFFSYSPSFATQTAMNAAVPFGSYLFTANNSGTAFTQTATLNYTTDAFTTAIPALTAASFNALNGLNPTNALAIGFNSFTPNASATEGFTFFSISDGSGTVFTDEFLAPNTTSLLLPAGTLAPNTTYTFELDFSDRIDGTDPGGVPTFVGSDVRTDGNFTTGLVTPEPATVVLAACGLLVLIAFKRRIA